MRLLSRESIYVPCGSTSISPTLFSVMVGKRKRKTLSATSLQRTGTACNCDRNSVSSGLLGIIALLVFFTCSSSGKKTKLNIHYYRQQLLISSGSSQIIFGWNLLRWWIVQFVLRASCMFVVSSFWNWAVSLPQWLCKKSHTFASMELTALLYWD